MLPIRVSEKHTAIELRKPHVFLSMVSMTLSWGTSASRSVLVEIYRRTHMKILCMFVDPLEDLCDSCLVFFVLENPLPHPPVQHLIKFEDIINEYPAQYQNRNVQR